MDTSISDDNWSARYDRIFHNGYFDYRRTFQQFLLRCAVLLGEHSRQKTVMDTSLSDIIAAHAMMRNAWVYQSVSQYYLQKKFN